MAKQQLTIITLLASALAIVLAIVSYQGAFIASTYARETASMAAQGAGQDIIDLAIVVPLLVISLCFVRRKNRIALYTFSGTVLYILYSFIIYCFGIHFNRLFLLYCLTLGVSLYTFILVMPELTRTEATIWSEARIPRRAVAIFFLVVAGLFYLLWMKDIVPAVLSNTTPKSVSDYNLLVNPVHVIDIAFALPGIIIIAILLFKKHALGYNLAPVALVFIILLTLALTGMMLMLQARGVSDDTSLVVIFIILGLISIVFLYSFIKHVARPT